MSHGSGECSGKGPTHGHRRKIVQIKGSHDFIRGNILRVGLQHFCNNLANTSKRCREKLLLVDSCPISALDFAKERVKAESSFECVAQQMAVALAPQSAENLPSMHLALWLDFSKGRKKCQEQIRRNAARESTRHVT